jgi:putative phosphoesterase
MAHEYPPVVHDVECFAALSDIHSNLKALRSVWREITLRGMDRYPVLNAGDSIVYGENPEECLAFLAQHPEIVTVQGNYDKHVARFPDNLQEMQRKWGKSRPDKLRAIADAAARTGKEWREWLRELPRQIRIDINGHRLALCHYVPGSSKEGISASTPEERLAQIARTVDADIVVVGHTHSPFARMVDGVLFVNPGCIGRRAGSGTWAKVNTPLGGPATGEIIKCPP